MAINGIDPEMITIFWNLVAAMLCGVVLGTERILARKTAGMRTYALVSMGAAFFITVGALVLKQSGVSGFVPFHLLAAIISGIGFMGAGVIILRGTNVQGLTTASGLWVAAGIGAACGYGFVVPAFIATMLTLFIFIILWYIEQGVKKFAPGHDNLEE